jgi:hypothetical protein
VILIKKCCSKNIIKKRPDKAMATFLKIVEDDRAPIKFGLIGLQNYILIA